MPAKPKKVSLRFFVIITLLLVGLVPLVLTGWLLSDKSGRELRSAENRYQIQLVQEKASQIEIFGQRYSSIVAGLASGLELANDPAVLSSAQTERKLGAILRENPELLALYVKPADQAPLTVFRSEFLSGNDVEAISASASAAQAKGKVAVGEPQNAGPAGQFVISFTSDVNIDELSVAKVVAIASLKSISQGIVGVGASKEEELWNAGLPIVFVVNGAGEALFHPDASLAAARKPMSDLKIVQEWLASGVQIQSALVPFTATFNGRSRDMIGAYSTAQLTEGQNVGVITMQDESRALASVGEMRTQAWLISMAFAVLALIVGLVSRPVYDLADHAARICRQTDRRRRFLITGRGKQYDRDRHARRDL